MYDPPEGPVAWISCWRFIADSEVLKKGMDRKAYQYHLLKVVLKKRIVNVPKGLISVDMLVKQSDEEPYLFTHPFTDQEMQRHLVIRKDGQVEKYGYDGAVRRIIFPGDSRVIVVPAAGLHACSFRGRRSASLACGYGQESVIQSTRRQHRRLCRPGRCCLRAIQVPRIIGFRAGHGLHLLASLDTSWPGVDFAVDLPPASWKPGR